MPQNRRGEWNLVCGGAHSIKNLILTLKKNQWEPFSEGERVPVARGKPQTSLRTVLLGLFFLSKVDVVVVQQK